MIFLEILLTFYFLIALFTKDINKRVKYLTLGTNLIFGIIPLIIGYIIGTGVSPILIEWLYYGVSLYHLLTIFLDMKMKNSLIRKTVYGFGILASTIIIVSSYLIVFAEGY